MLLVHALLVVTTSIGSLCAPAKIVSKEVSDNIASEESLDVAAIISLEEFSASKVSGESLNDVALMSDEEASGNIASRQSSDDTLITDEEIEKVIHLEEDPESLYSDEALDNIEISDEVLDDLLLSEEAQGEKVMDPIDSLFDALDMATRQIIEGAQVLREIGLHRREARQLLERSYHETQYI